LHNYDTTFHSYAANTSYKSARRIATVVRTLRPVTSVLDIGCAYGTWLRAWQDEGVEDCAGVDGNYVDRARLEIDGTRFTAYDVAQRFDLGRTFDVVESLEVAEHLPAAAAQTFVDNLVRHGDLILFSAALPGQGGEFHVNEQPPEYWRDLFAAHDYVGIDCIRGAIVGDGEVSPWYRYNCFVYARQELFDRLDDSIRRLRLPASGPILDISPLSYRLRRAIVRRLPYPIVNAISRAIAAWHR
jgi:SAM-dependent methyltransferase